VAKVLVLGANGFIGSHLVDDLVKAGHTVRAFDRFSSDRILFDKHNNIEIYRGDYLNNTDLEKALEDIEYVFHFISTTTPATADNNPTIDIDTNIRRSVELLQLCVQANVKRVLFASTGGAIYGSIGDSQPYKETDLPKPVSPYAIGKLTVENYLRYFKVKHGLDFIAFRISNPYGERQPFNRKQGVIPIFLENIARDKPITVFGDGSMVRDYIYVKDLTRMIVSVFERPHEHSVYNLGSGEGKSLKQLLDTIETVIDRQVSVETRDTPTTFVQEVILDTSRFASEFNELSTTSLEDGIRATYDYTTSEIAKENNEQG
jgi:UDP-glucose 4-epimerase